MIKNKTQLIKIILKISKNIENRLIAFQVSKQTLILQDIKNNFQKLFLKTILKNTSQTYHKHPFNIMNPPPGTSQVDKLKLDDGTMRLTSSAIQSKIIYLFQCTIESAATGQTN